MTFHSDLLPVELNNIPKELKLFRQWVAWKAKPSGNGKVSKIPIDPKTGKNASTTDPNTWSSYINAVLYYITHKAENICGIGFVFKENDPFCGIDLDNCYDPKTGEIENTCLKILEYIDSYSEISPSNTGIKIIAKGKLPGSGRNFKGIFGKSDVEIYDNARFFTLTGARLNIGSENVEDRSKEIVNSYHRLCEITGSTKPKAGKSWQGDIDSLPVSYGTKKLIREGEKRGRRSEAIMSVVNALVSGGISDDAIFSIFDNYPIGEKYKEKGAAKHNWLKKHIKKAHSFVSTRNDTATIKHSDFPEQVISGLAGIFAQTYGSYLEPPDHFFYMSFLTMFGLAVSDQLHLEAQRKPQPRLYTILLGESANARKSTAMDETDKFFREFFTIDDFEVCRGAASGEGIAKLMTENPKVLLYYDELNVFVSKANIKNSTLLSATTTLFESNEYANQTSKNPTIIENGLVSMLAASTTDTYSDLFDPKFINIGFNNRLFLVPGDSNKCFPVPEPIPYEKNEDISKHLNNCLQLIEHNPVISIDKNAVAKWKEFYKTLKGSSPYAKRLDTYGLRLMPLLAVNDMKSSVDTETVDKIISLIDWQHNVRKIYDPIDAEGKIAKMEEKIRRAFLSQNVWKKRDLQLKVNYNKPGIWVWETAVKNLVNNEELNFDVISKTYTKA
jgi:hypothetical protein